jgi:hypothetical protein
MSATDKPRLTGTEIMLRSMGMGEILDAAKALADNGTLTKILTFADHAESLVAKVEELNANVTAMRAELQYVGGRVERVGAGPGSGNGGLVEPTDGPVLVSEQHGDARPKQAGHDGALHDAHDNGDEVAVATA